jgi:ATP-dependent helicase/nuclease subunit A
MQMEEIMSSTSPQVTPLKTSILRAGAGAGKTTTLIKLFEDVAVNFHKSHRRYPRMVLTTFTRKATQELRERLLSEALKKEQSDMFRYINQRSKVHISTIHGVLSLYLMQFGKELGLAPELRVMDGPEINFRQRRVLKNLLLKNSDWLELVEIYDIQVLLSMLGSYYQYHFLHEKMEPVSYDELKKLVQKRLNAIAAQGYQFYKEISQNELSEGWSNYISVFSAIKDLSTAEDLDKFFDGLGRKPAFSSKKPPFDEAIHEAFADYVKENKAFVQEDSLRENFLTRHAHLADKFQSLAKAFCEENLTERLTESVLSMTDLEGLSLRLIRQSPWSAKKFAAQWDFWMIDEYQDTSPLQVELLNHLVGDSHHFVVGDPQQSIYLFRGARSDVFHAKVSEIEKASGEVRTALTNYRSRAPLLEFINSYFSKKPSFSAMTPFKNEGLGDLCAEAIVVEKNEQGDAEARAILALIQEKLASGVPAQDICVLSRTNKILEDIAQLAFKIHLPVQLHSAGGFSSRREIYDFLAILKFLVNPHDNLNLLSVLRSPWFLVSDEDLLKITSDRARNISIWAHWQMNRNQVALKVLQALQNYKLTAEQIGLSETMSQVMIERGLIDLSQHLDPSGRREANLWKILTDLKAEEAVPGFNPLQFAEDLQKSAEGEDEGDATPVIEPDRVNLMTVHASKGLQFGHVIIAGFGKDSRKFYGDWWMIDEATGTWTMSLRASDQKKTVSLFGQQIVKERQKREAEESDRVLYVAMTRAKYFLSLVWTSEFRKGSWASEFPFDATEGEHRGEKFTYRVRTSLPDPEPLFLETNISNSYRAPFKELSSEHSEIKSRNIDPESIKFILEKTKKGSDSFNLFQALKYQPSLWNDSTFEMAEAVSYLKSLKEIPFAEILESGETDWSFTAGRALVMGEVDLCAQLPGANWLVQYKSGSMKDSQKILSQLETYVVALRETGAFAADVPCKLVVVYPTDNEFRIKAV